MFFQFIIPSVMYISFIYFTRDSEPLQLIFMYVVLLVSFRSLSSLLRLLLFVRLSCRWVEISLFLLLLCNYRRRWAQALLLYSHARRLGFCTRRTTVEWTDFKVANQLATSVLLVLIPALFLCLYKAFSQLSSAIARYFYSSLLKSSWNLNLINKLLREVLNITHIYFILMKYNLFKLNFTLKHFWWRDI